MKRLRRSFGGGPFVTANAPATSSASAFNSSSVIAVPVSHAWSPAVLSISYSTQLYGGEPRTTNREPRISDFRRSSRIGEVHILLRAFRGHAPSSEQGPRDKRAHPRCEAV